MSSYISLGLNSYNQGSDTKCEGKTCEDYMKLANKLDLLVDD